MRRVCNFQAAYTLGGFAFTIMPGILAQPTGGYEANYAICAVFMVICAVLVLGVYRIRDTHSR